MKWGTLIKDLKGKVGIAETTADLTAGDVPSDILIDPPSSSSASPSSIYTASAQHDFSLLSPTRYFTFQFCVT